MINWNNGIVNKLRKGWDDYSEDMKLYHNEAHIESVKKTFTCGFISSLMNREEKLELLLKFCNDNELVYLSQIMDGYHDPVTIEQLANEWLDKNEEMLPPGSAPIYTHSLEYMEQYRDFQKFKQSCTEEWATECLTAERVKEISDSISDSLKDNCIRTMSKSIADLEAKMSRMRDLVMFLKDKNMCSVMADRLIEQILEKC